VPYTFANLKEELRPLIFPGREAANLRPAHDKMFVEALVDAQRMSECLTYNNTNIFPQCATYFQCGMTLLPAPRGAIKRLYVVDRINPTTGREDAAAPLDWCSRIDYQQVRKCDMEKYVAAVASGCGSCGTAMSSVFGYPLAMCGEKSFPTPTDAGWLNAAALPMGLHYPQSSTDSRCGRARKGVWAIERGRIYVAPWIQSTETIIVEWDGIKREWDDGDVLEDDPTLKRAVRYFVAAGQAKDYDRDDAAWAAFRRDYDEAIRDLIWECRQETMVRGCEPSLARQSTAYVEFTRPTGGTSESPDGSHPALPDGTPTTTDNQSTCPDVAEVVFYPPTGAIVTYPIRVVLNSATAGATIYYTTDGTEPTRASLAYVGSFDLAAGSVKAAAFLRECPSQVTQSAYRDANDPDIVGPDGFAPKLTTLCTTTDRAGAWGVFHSDGSPDINWKLNFRFKPGAVIKRVEMFETDSSGNWTTGRSWATKQIIQGGFNSYPVVIDNAVGQIETAYTDNLAQAGDSDQDWFLFGESVGVPASGSYYRLNIYMEDGYVFYASCQITCLPPPDPVTYNCVSGNCVAIIGHSGSYPTLEACLAADCLPCAVEITASDLNATVTGPDCPCYTVTLSDQVSVTGGVLTGFAQLIDGVATGSFGPDYAPCLANPGIYTYRSYAVSDSGSCYDNVDFTVTLECSPCDDACPNNLSLQITGGIYEALFIEYYGSAAISLSRSTADEGNPCRIWKGTSSGGTHGDIEWTISGNPLVPVGGDSAWQLETNDGYVADGAGPDPYPGEERECPAGLFTSLTVSFDVNAIWTVTSA